MLATFPSYATLPTNDVARLRQFYEGLGFSVIEETVAGVYFQAGDETMFAVTRQSGQASGTHTQFGFRVHGIERVVADLRSRGVTMETYEVPRTSTASPTCLSAARPGSRIRMATSSGWWISKSQTEAGGVLRPPDAVGILATAPTNL